MSSQKQATLKSSTRWEATLAKIIQALKINYTKELVTASLPKVNEMYVIFIPPCRGWTNHNIWWPITRRNPIIHKMNTRFFSWDSRACRHANPRCVDLHLMVQRLIGNSKPSSPRAPQKPTTSDVTQWHEQFTRVVFGAPLEKAQHPSQITGRWPRTSTTLATTPPLPPSRLGGSNHQEKQESHSQRSPKWH
jgi:hypothetical protein